MSRHPSCACDCCRYADNFDTMQTAVAHALECALDVQNKQGAYLTTVGVTLHIKIGISAGEVIILLLGNDEVSCYLELGRAIVAVNKGVYYAAQLVRILQLLILQNIRLHSVTLHSRSVQNQSIMYSVRSSFLHCAPHVPRQK